MRIYNTLSGKVEEFTPQDPSTLKIYTCGPTVYDYSHVGHWFTYVRMDVLIRTLKASGYQPNWIMNITDVGHLVSDADEGEDKLEKGAKREGKTAWEIAEFYTKDFLEGMKALNISEPTQLVKATDHIAEQIELIKQLEAKGYIYVIDDGVYYDTSKFKTYADFARLDIDEQQAGARVEYNPSKHNPQDFALWKFSPKDHKRDMEWDSPWGKGFPGWHIECSAMSLKYLGPTLDMHTGGMDHVPVHHTNEIAQSEAVTGKRFSNYWMHTNHVLVEGEKISKSLDNSITLQDLEDKHICPEALRLHVLESHYRSQSKFSWDSMTAAQNRLQDLKAMAALRHQCSDKPHSAPTFAMEHVGETLLNCLANDLDTPKVLAFLSNVCSQLSATLIAKDLLPHFEQMLEGIDACLGLKLTDVKDISEEQKSLIAEREEARKTGDWSKADKLRQTLKQQSIGLRDTDCGPIWFPLLRLPDQSSE
jgi:cysteinyl-tRNA synthetase